MLLKSIISCANSCFVLNFKDISQYLHNKHNNVLNFLIICIISTILCEKQSKKQNFIKTSLTLQNKLIFWCFQQNKLYFARFSAEQGLLCVQIQQKAGISRVLQSKQQNLRKISRLCRNRSFLQKSLAKTCRIIMQL